MHHYAATKDLMNEVWCMKAVGQILFQARDMIQWRIPIQDAIHSSLGLSTAGDILDWILQIPDQNLTNHISYVTVHCSGNFLQGTQP